MFRVFYSRWSALFWAAGVLWTAYDIANAQPRGGDAAAVDATGTPVNAADLAALANAAG